jgi:hypothetical protein
MSWVISVSSRKPDRQLPGLTVAGRGMHGSAWCFHMHGPRWQATAVRHVLAELCAFDEPAMKQDK